jgi:archaellum component FlaC
MKQIWMGGLTVLLCASSFCAAAEKPTGQNAVNAALPLRDVVLFSSGVGYFGRNGSVGGNTGVLLSFRAEQINDILKSLVVLDPQGKVRPITYTTKDALGRRLRGVGQALNNQTSLGQLLRQFQGARVRVTSRAGTFEGRIISVSEREVTVKEEVVIKEFLNLMTARGLASVALDEVTALQLLDERLDNELRSSLELLAGGLDNQRQSVQINFGDGAPREVRVGYLQETPVWKTSYRLVLDKTGAPYLQGWGIVENTTDEDWQNVNLSLVSGRPISFIQDLYQPLYVPRPVVAPQVVGSPLPQTYGETLTTTTTVESEEAQADERMLRPARKASNAAATPPAVMLPGASGPMSGTAGFGGEGVNGLMADASGRRRESGLSAAQLGNIQAQAQGETRGELFEYAIAQPVTLPRQQAAMVPIIGQAIEGERLSIYDPSAGERALLGLRLKNSTGLHLAGGPVTVFREGIYAGDAQFTNLQPGEERLISYAVDLDLVTDRKQPGYRRETVSFAVKSGVLTISHREFREMTYTLRNKSNEAKTVLIQQPIEANFTPVEPKEAFEKTAQHYRFKQEVLAGKTVEFKTVFERPISETLALLNINLDMLVAYARNDRVSAPLRTALEDLITRRRKITDIQAQLARIEREIKDIDTEQDRIRRNMDRLDRNSELYKQYVAKLTEQEKKVNELAEQRAKLRDSEEVAQKELREFVDALNID